MMRTVLGTGLLVMAMGLWTPQVAASVVVVDGSGGGDYETIQEAIDASEDGDVIQVHPGVYTDSGQWVADCSQKAITLEGVGGAAQTVIDGQGTRPGVLFHDYGNNGHENKIEGFTIRNCVSNLWGAGIRVEIGPTTIRHCVFEDNGQANRYAGAINATGQTLIESCTFRRNIGVNCGAVSGSSATIRECLFEFNEAVYSAGAIWTRGPQASPMQVYDCVFRHNTSGLDAGAVRVCCGSSMIMSGCEFEYNSCGDRGGAIQVETDNIDGNIIEDTVFVQCHAAQSGGAIWTGADVQLSTIDISQCTALVGGAIYIDANTNTQSQLTNSKIWRNTSDVDGAVAVASSDGQELVVSDTMFCGNLEQDLSGSWIDAGGNDWGGTSCPWECDEDITGDFIVGVDDLLVVLDRFGTTSQVADINGDGIVDVNDILMIVSAWGPCEQ